jgi:hypothetical protein
MPAPGDSETAGAPEGAKEGAAADSAGTPAAQAAQAAPSGPVKRGAALRRELVAKLPQLAVTGDSAGAMNVDPAAVDLDADAFIGPLHALVSEGRG